MAGKKPLQRTHLGVSEALVGKAEEIETGKSATASLLVTKGMAADEKGLAHGGFTFSLADYAAMLAVNEPHVVLASSSAKFTGPVAVGDRLTAHADVLRREGKKIFVRCDAVNQHCKKVFEGEFVCIIPAKHVLDR